jgi:hypothetical protein
LDVEGGNGSEDEPVHPREDSVSPSIEQTRGEFTKDKEKDKDKEEILVYANELVYELYGRLVRRRYMFRTVGVNLVRTIFQSRRGRCRFPGFRQGAKASLL